MTKLGTCPICKTNRVVLRPIDGRRVRYICGDCLFIGIDEVALDDKANTGSQEISPESTKL